MMQKLCSLRPCFSVVPLAWCAAKGPARGRNHQPLLQRRGFSPPPRPTPKPPAAKPRAPPPAKPAATAVPPPPAPPAAPVTPKEAKPAPGDSAAQRPTDPASPTRRPPLAIPPPAGQWMWVTTFPSGLEVRSREYFASRDQAELEASWRVKQWKQPFEGSLAVIDDKGTRRPFTPRRTTFFSVVGMRFYGDHSFQETDKVALQKDPENKHDPNAVKVLVGDQHVAFVLAVDCLTVRAVISRPKYRIRLVKKYPASALFSLERQ
eukprot:EG_transcript_18300